MNESSTSGEYFDGHVSGAMIVAKNQTDRYVFLHRTKVLRHPLPDRLKGFPAAGAGKGMGSIQFARAMVDGNEDIGACSDAELLAKIEAVIAASPFNGEGYRKVWARLRADGVRTAMRRVCRIMRENSLLAPQRPVDREEHPHDGTIVTDRVDQMWGTDMTQTVTTGEGRWGPRRREGRAGMA